jgi:hypothetical protein
MASFSQDLFQLWTVIKFTDVKVEYPESFLGQMLELGKKYALLPVVN